MDQTKSHTVRPETKDHQPKMTSLETYQRRWEQLMEDTEKELQKIRGSSLTPELSDAGKGVADGYCRGRSPKVKSDF